MEIEIGGVAPCRRSLFAPNHIRLSPIRGFPRSRSEFMLMSSLRYSPAEHDPSRSSSIPVPLSVSFRGMSGTNWAWVGNSWGREFHDESGVVPNALKWDGIDCDFGGLEVAIIDARTGNRSESQILVAKFPRFDIPKSHRVSRPLPLLGMDFLHTNALRLIIDGRGSALVGEFETP